MRLFPLTPYFRKTAALTRSTPLWAGLTQQWTNEQWPNAGCTQEGLLDPAAARAPRLRPGASLPQKSSGDNVAAAFQGLWAPGFTLNDLVPTPANVAVFRGLLGPGGFNRLYQNVLPAMEPLLPVWPKTLPDPILLLEIRPSPPPQSTARYQLQSCRLCAPLRSLSELMEGSVKTSGGRAFQVEKGQEGTSSQKLRTPLHGEALTGWSKHITVVQHDCVRRCETMLKLPL
ncbi:uncharacterized protein LOC125177129 isoform X3 [Prionailurus viverrinus]|uniref:uncharacterized protein LOC125177129 isoform X3 n=1 Tax=Prionailurus viverrinus TaxID=61388 RepID=UPI001FF480B3|nr:uncharacterized protein LOC125177129 isoform X3 [Prionailurus viverrinus]